MRESSRGSPDSYNRNLTEIYAQRQYEPLWLSSSNHLNAEGQVLFKILTEAEQIGLNPKDYDRSELQWLLRTDQLFSDGQPVFHTNVSARFEIVLSKNLLKLIDHISSGRLPNRVNEKWYLQDERPPLTDIVSLVLEKGIAATLDTFAGGHQGYKPLLTELKRYLRIKNDGGWPVIADGPFLAKGSTDSRIKALRQRLADTADLKPENNQTIFDQELVEGVKKFQARHGLSVDGIVGPQTLETLNIPVQSLIRQILVNLERRRWMPRTFGSDYIVVNIPDYRLMAYRNGQPQLTMPIIVGKPMSQTPVFSDILEYLVFNPYWNVPASIAQEEILQKFREDATYLEKKNYEVVDRDDQLTEVSLLTENNIETGTIRLRQKPGPDNALGLVKFMFPNDHAVYLHDTPAGHLFDASERDFSHGCIRVERPVDLAKFLLQENWSRQDIQHMLDGSERQVIHLPQSTPVYILYLTTWVAEDGTLQFRDDPYGHDDQLWTALQPVLSTHRDFSNHPI